MGKVVEFPRRAAWPPLPLRRPVPSVRSTYLLDRAYPPGHPLHGQRAVTVTDARVLLDPELPQPAGSRLYDLVARHHNRQPRDWVTLGQLAEELTVRGLDWQRIGLDPARVCAGLTRLYLAGRRGLVAEDPAPTSPLARRLVRHHAHDPAMAPYAAGWAAAQQAEDDANLAAWLQAHPEATLPTATRQAADEHDDDERGWCPSWADDDAGHADEWTDEDEALTVAEANALYEREQAERAAHGGHAAARPARPRSGLVDVDPAAWRQHHRQPRGQRRAGSRWWFHAFWWLVIIALTVGAYRLVT